MVNSAHNSASSRSASRSAAVCVFAVGILLASCSTSGGEDAATTPPNTMPPPATSEPAAPTTAEAPSTTVAATTTVEDTSTSVDASAAADAAIRTAIALAQTSFSDCLVVLPDCDPATLSVARAGELLERNTSLIEQWKSLGYTVRDRDRFRYVVESVTVDPSLESAVATVCIADGSRLVLPNAAPDGGDVVIDDEFTSGRSEWDLRLDADGMWRLYSSTPIGVAATEDVCGDA